MEKIKSGIGIKEKELCKACFGTICTSCRYSEICKIFTKEKGRIPTYCTDIEGNYNGKDKDKLWENVNKKIERNLIMGLDIISVFSIMIDNLEKKEYDKNKKRK